MGYSYFDETEPKIWTAFQYFLYNFWIYVILDDYINILVVTMELLSFLIKIIAKNRSS
jgi:phage-related protein